MYQFLQYTLQLKINNVLFYCHLWSDTLYYELKHFSFLVEKNTNRHYSSLSICSLVNSFEEVYCNNIN